jgi:hypothetical protein
MQHLSKIPLVLTKTDVERYQQQQVLVYAKYVPLQLPTSARPDAPLIATQKAELQLKDGSSLFIFPLWDARSNRSIEEHQTFGFQAVKATGVMLAEQGNDPVAPYAARIVGACLLLETLELGTEP